MMTRTAKKIFTPNRIAKDVLLVILDLDRTPFDTGNYFADFAEWAKSVMTAKIRNEFIAGELAGNFDVINFLKHQGFAPDEVKRSFKHFIQQKYGTRSHSYLMPGAAKLIEFLKSERRIMPFIITEGSESHQKFKLELTREFDGLLYHITSGNKGVLIQHDLDRYGGYFELEGKFYEEIAVVDDKSSSLKAIRPNSAKRLMLFHYAPPGAKYSAPAGRKDIEEIIHLTQVQSTLGAYLRPPLR